MHSRQAGWLADHGSLCFGKRTDSVTPFAAKAILDNAALHFATLGSAPYLGFVARPQIHVGVTESSWIVAGRSMAPTEVPETIANS